MNLSIYRQQNNAMSRALGRTIHFFSDRAGQGAASDQDDTAICIQNIGPAEQRKRMLSGVMGLAVGLGLGLLLIVTGTDRWWRLVLFFPFAMAAIGIDQARAKT